MSYEVVGYDKVARKIAYYVKHKIAILDNKSQWSQAMHAKLRHAVGTHPGAIPGIWEIILANMPDSWHSRGVTPSFEVYAIHTALTLYALHCQGKDHSMCLQYESNQPNQPIEQTAPVGSDNHGGDSNADEQQESSYIQKHSDLGRNESNENNADIDHSNNKMHRESIGSAIAKLIRSDDSNFSAVKRRFDIMATSEVFSELAFHVRGVVRLLKSGDIPLDYPGFASDLYIFQIPGRSNGIRLRWGEDFYRERISL